MARKKSKLNLQMTPLMMLSTMAFFLATGVIFQISNAQTAAKRAAAAEPEVIYVTVTPTPEAMDEDAMMMKK